MFKIYKKSGNDLYDFTDYCGAISLRNNYGRVSEELSFSIQGKFINEADIILLYKDTTQIYEGIVIRVEQDQYNSNLVCLDYGIYLNQNEDIYQFKDTVSNCIKKILTDFNIPIGDIININVNYNNINRGQLSELISNLLEYATKNNGKKYIFEMRNNKFYLEEEGTNIVIYKTDLFTGNYDITNFIKNPSYVKSIETLKNAVKVVQQEDNYIKVLAYKEDSNSINKYGKFQKLESLSKEESKNAKNIATNQLKLLNKVTETFQVELPGIIECRSNKVLRFDDEVMNIKGDFKVLECTHNITSTSHLMVLQMEVL